MPNPINIALHFLKFRPRSIFEVREKLKSKKIAEKEIDEVIRTLKENKLLDDEAFVKMWIHDRNLFKPTGVIRLKMELNKLGLDKDLISEMIERQDEEALAKDAVNRKLRSYARYEGRELKEKLLAFLMRRGFSYGVAKKALEDM